MAPLILIGFARLSALALSGQEKRVEEYGIHWNFFFTLVGVTLAGVFVEPIVAVMEWALCRAGHALGFSSWPHAGNTAMQGWILATIGLCLAGGYQAWLDAELRVGSAIARRQTGYLWMVRDGARHGLTDMNREGVFGSIGYIGAWCIAAGVARGFMANRPRGQVGWRRVCLGLMGLGAIMAGTGLWVHAGTKGVVGDDALDCSADTSWVFSSYCKSVSRRVVNLPFVLWLTGLNLGLLGSLLGVELVLPLRSQGGSSGGSTGGSRYR